MAFDHRPQPSAPAGRPAQEVWSRVRDTTWRSQVLGPRWEAVVRDHIARGDQVGVGPVEQVGVSTVSDRAARRSHELDLLALRAGEVVALGEAKLRKLGRDDLVRLLRVRDLLGAPNATIVLAPATGVELSSDAPANVIKVEPADVYT